MRSLICELFAPPDVFDILLDLAHNGVEGFIRELVHRAKSEDGLTLYRADGTANDAPFILTAMLIGRAAGERWRTGMIESGDLLEGYATDEGDLHNCDGLFLVTQFASDELLDKMIALIPPDVKSALIPQITPEELQVHVRVMFLH